MSMRAHVLACLLAFVSGLSWAADLTIGSYSLVSSRRLSVSVFEFVYRVQVTNTGTAMRNVVGTVVTSQAGTTITDGMLHFGDVPAGATVTSIDTITLRQDRLLPFNASNLIWTLTGSPLIESRFDVLPASAGPSPFAVRLSPRPLTATAIVRYEWFVNGMLVRTSGIGDDLNWTFSSPGTYPVALTVQDTEGRRHTSSKTVQVTPGSGPVGASPQAYLMPNNGGAPLRFKVHFAPLNPQNVTAISVSAPGAVPASWTYVRPAGASLPGSSPEFSHGQVGVHQVSVTYSYANGLPVTIASGWLKLGVGDPGLPTVEVEARQDGTTFPMKVQFTVTIPTAPETQHRMIMGNILSGCDQVLWFNYDQPLPLNSIECIYRGPGTYFPQLQFVYYPSYELRIDGSVIAALTLEGSSSVALDTDTLDVQLMQSVKAKTTLNSATRVSLVVETLAGLPVRTLFALTNRAAGSYADVWDGRGDNGVHVAEGVYKFVLIREIAGTLVRTDVSASTGGQRLFPARTSPESFEPYNGQPLTIDITLDKAAEMSAFIGSYFVDTRYVTLFTRRPFGRGTHRVTWNGENSDGQLIALPPGQFSGPFTGTGTEHFLFGAMAYSLPGNAVFVRNGVQLSALSASPSIFDPTGLSFSGAPLTSTIQFTLSMPSNAELTVRDTLTGLEMNRLQFSNLAAGVNTVSWDGKASDGRFVTPGTYRIGVYGYQANGQRSMINYVLQRVFY